MELVSVIIPAYNKAELTRRAVESVLRQIYSPVEVIVVDDGSVDDTRQTMASFANRILYHYQSNAGASAARNAGIGLSKGKYLAFLDCDDEYHPDKIAQSVQYLEAHPQVGFIHTAAEFIDAKGQCTGYYSHPQSIYQGWIARRLIMGNFICNSTVVVRRECFEATGGYDTSIFPPADWDMWLRLALHFQTGYIDKPLTRYRVTDNFILNKLELTQQEEICVITKFFKAISEQTLPAAKAIPGLTPALQSRVMSLLFFRFACSYLVIKDYRRWRENIYLAIGKWPFNLKAWAVLAAFYCARRKLFRILEQKILRYETNV